MYITFIIITLQNFNYLYFNPNKNENFNYEYFRTFFYILITRKKYFI